MGRWLEPNGSRKALNSNFEYSDAGPLRPGDAKCQEPARTRVLHIVCNCFYKTFGEGDVLVRGTERSSIKVAIIKKLNTGLETRTRSLP